MNNEQFGKLMHDIQHGPSIEKPVSNTRSFVHPTSTRMDDPRTAAYTHLKNLIRTYGIDIVLEAMDHAVGE